MTYSIGDEVRTTAMFNVKCGMSFEGVVDDVLGDLVVVDNGIFLRTLYKNNLARR